MPGLVAFLSNTQIAAQEAAAVETTEKTAAQKRADALVGNLGAYIEKCWQAAYTAKQPIQMEMMESLRQCNGEYDPQKLAAIRSFGGSEVFMPMTGSIVRTAYSWLRDVVLPTGGRPFATEPTPLPDLSPDITQTIVMQTMEEAAAAAQMAGAPVPPSMIEARAKMRYDDAQKRLKQEADLRNSRMETKIDDVFTEGGYYTALDECLPDVISLKLGCVKGPVTNKVPSAKWVQRDGMWVADVEQVSQQVYYRVSPLDLYPAPDSKGVNDGYLFERIPMRRSKIYAMIGEKGYDEKRIREALEEYERGFDLNLSYDQERNDAEGNDQYRDSPDRSIDVLEFHGTVRGKWLVEWGMDATDVPDEDREYDVTCMRIGRFIVRCVLNDDPLCARPYGCAYYHKPVAGFWGQGIPHIVRDIQSMVNGCARALMNNMGMAAMPLTEIEADRLADGQELKGIYPGMTIQTKSNSGGSPGPAVRFSTVPIVAQALLEVYKYFTAAAAQYSGIPTYEQGVNPSGGAAGTASGLSMLMNATTRQFKATVASVDGITEGAVTRTYNYEMRYGTDPSIKGDIKFKAIGVSTILVKEQQQMRRAEFLQQTNNPVDMSIIGPEGRAEALRSIADGLDLPDIVPEKEALLQKLKAAAMQAVGLPGPGGGAPPLGLPAPAALAPDGQPAGGRAANLVS
jgi:hypothetical protein